LSLSSGNKYIETLQYSTVFTSHLILENVITTGKVTQTCAEVILSSFPSLLMTTLVFCVGSSWFPSLYHVIVGVGTPEAGHKMVKLLLTTTLGFVCRRLLSITDGTAETQKCQTIICIYAILNSPKMINVKHLMF